MPEEKNKKKIWYQLRVLIYRFRKLRKLKKAEQYDFCASFLDSANLVNILTPYAMAKTVLSEHICLSEACSRSTVYRYLIGPMVRWLYNRADLIIPVSKEMKADLVRNYHVHSDLCHVVYNGMDLYTGGKIQRKDNAFIITTMGRLEEMKGQWHLIRSVAVLASKYPQIRLVVLGDGSLRHKLEMMTARLGIEDRVSFPGFVSQPMEIIASSDLYVFPSLYEGFSMAMVEAMSCGVPIISSDFRSGARELLAPETDCEKKIQKGIEWARYGCLVPVSHILINKAEDLEEMDEGEKSLCQAIERFIEDGILRERYGKKAAERARDFTIEKMVQSWMKELYQVCGKNT